MVGGIVYGLLAWRTDGLEAGSAIHSINNLMSVCVVGLGLGTISSTVSMWDFVADIVITLLCGFLVYYMGSKKDWFAEKTSD